MKQSKTPAMCSTGLVGLLVFYLAVSAEGPTARLEDELRREDPATLAAEARRSGDLVRGAAIFYRPSLTCVRCHAREPGATPLGPDLSQPGAAAADTFLVESILDPSKVIKKGFETVTVATGDGRVVMGLVAEDRPGVLSLRDPGQDGRVIRLRADEIESRRNDGPSLMPGGLVNNLTGRQEFLDLVRYLMEIVGKGPDRARELRPKGELAARPPLPSSERDIDHAGLIKALDQESYRRGEAIYQRVCINCHGTKEQAGSLPTSLRFASGVFKNGGDPFSLYRTLTLGFGQMTPQTWMVPRQKYDVIHYIREAYLKPHNPGQYRQVDRGYLATLPAGTSRGQEPVEIQPWETMDYGPSLSATYEVSPGDLSNLVAKGIAIRLDAGPGGVSRGNAWAVYDEDTLRLAVIWTGRGFIDWNGINFNGRHQVHPRIVGQAVLTNPNQLGWANPFTGSFDADLRAIRRDGPPAGPLPRHWVHYQGHYRHGDRTILSYSVGQAQVFETVGLESGSAWKDRPVFSRTIQVGKSPHDLRLRVAAADPKLSVALAGRDRSPARLHTQGFTFLNIPAAVTPTTVKLLMARDVPPVSLTAYANRSGPPEDLQALTRGGPARWPERLVTRVALGRDSGPFAVDTLTVPESNPWLCQTRLSGFDFLPDGRRAAVCTWDGDVWMVEGVDHPEKGLSWRRIASGLFQPLGLKIRDGAIFVGCRDQIVRLRDLNGDGETDFYENFNNDHQVTEHFHEFAMDLETDADGNFYYTKAACHGLPATVPQHGTLLKVSKDGRKTEILATGFRAPNGVCLNSDGTFYLSDQEGFWTPKNRINLVKRGGFYGNLWGFTDVTDPSDSAMEQPVCWLTNRFDRSPSQLVWVTSTQPGWKPLAGSLLCLSYGYGQVFVVMRQTVGDLVQGGEVALPIERLPTGLIRGRFHPSTGDLHACGLFAWAGDQTQPGGFYRLRATGKPMCLPIELEAHKQGLRLRFTDRLDPACVADLSRYAIKTWTIKRTIDYGSDHHDERALAVKGARLSGDGLWLSLNVPEIHPTRCMEISLRLRAADGKPVDRVIHNTIHALADQPGETAENRPAK